MSHKPKHIGSTILDQFKYDEVNGGVIRVNGKGKGIDELKPNPKGYIHYCVSVGLVQSNYVAHRIVYLLHYPDMDQSLQIDHINGDKEDNRIENLRAVTNQQNHFNETKALGFCWVAEQSKFRARIHVDYKSIHLGCYDTILEARASYLRAKKKYHVIEER